jgi:pilus assembly protein CpaF
MHLLTIFREGAAPTRAELPDGVHVAGSGERCRVRLPGPGVSERHALFQLSGEKATVEDMGSDTGTLVNAVPVAKRTPVTASTPITIGPYTLTLSFVPASAGGPPADGHTVTPSHGQTVEPSGPCDRATDGPCDPPEAPPPADDPAAELRRSVKRQIHQELVSRLDIKRLSAARVRPEELRRRAVEQVESILGEIRGKLPPDMDPAALGKEILDEALGLGPLEELLADDSVSEIMVNGPDRIFVERKGKLVLTGRSFMDEAAVMAAIERIVSPLGRRVDESQPYVDARLADGSRVNCVIHPLSLIGPCITIRKFARRQLFDRDLIGFGTMTQPMADFLRVCVLLRKNVVVSGGTGSGKTTLLNVLSQFIPRGERVVTVEDSAELKLSHRNIVRLEARPANIEGKGRISIRDLVINTLRMRPDRIIVGECRGAEALDMLQAMNTGHDGSLTTLHANTPRDALSRLENMVMMAGFELPSSAIREQICSAVNLIVQQTRLPDGSRKIVNITEVTGKEQDVITMQDIFVFKRTGFSPDGRVEGYHTATGNIPYFIEGLRESGNLGLDMGVFVPMN